MKRPLMIAAASALAIVVWMAPMIVSASSLGPPTEIYVSPSNQIADGCPYASADWTVELDGGTSGKYSVNVTYGNGVTSPWTQTYETTIPWSYTFNDPTCSHHVYHQYWTAQRGGGGTAHDDTYVTSN